MLYCKLYEARGIDPKTKHPLAIFATAYAIEGYSLYLFDFFINTLTPAGISVLGVDVYGTGKTSGNWVDEYSVAEQKQIDVIFKKMRKTKKYSKIGFVGLSYSGCVAIQAAARLDVDFIIPIYASLSSLTNDVWLINGLPLLTDLCGYALDQITYLIKDRNSKEKPTLLLETRLTNKRWIDIDPREIKCDTLAIAGWADLYSTSTLMLYEHVKNCVLIMGPWEHILPHNSTYGAQINLTNYIQNYMQGKCKFSCMIFLLDHSGYLGDWYSANTKNIKYLTTSADVNLEIPRTKEILTNTVYYSVTDCQVLDKVDLPMVELPLPGVSNVCGLLTASIRGIPKKACPFIIYFLLKRKKKFVIVSTCLYNPARETCDAKPLGIQIKSGDQLFAAFDLNTYPYIWTVSDTARLRLDGSITLKFSTYPSLKKMSGVEGDVITNPRMVFNKQGNKIMIDNGEELMIITRDTRHITVQHDYDASEAHTAIKSDGQNFTYALRMGDKTIKGQFKLGH